LCIAGATLVVCAGQSSRPSTRPLPSSQQLDTTQAEHDCDIDGSWKALEDCPSETIIGQYKDKYDLTVVLRGGVYWQVVSGQYVNEQYGYTVSIPDGVEALCTPPPMPWHGFFVDVANLLEPPIDASANHGGFSWANWNAGVFVEAYYNSLEYASADEAAEASLDYYKKNHPADLVILNHEHTKLRRVPATRYVVQFVDAESGETMIADELVAIRGSEGMIYNIGLTTTAARYSQDEMALKAIQKGLRFTQPE
jgi:hypothetical protein